MVGVPVSFKGSTAFIGQGFQVDFERPKPGPLEVLARDAVVVRGASVEAVVATTEQVKELIRDYIDTHFGNSEFHGNGRRRASNASAQSVFYDEIESKGQYAGLVYSKFGKRDQGRFVDFLLLHVRGGILKPTRGEWLRIPASGKRGGPKPLTGFYSFTRSDIFFAPSKDGKKLFQFRRMRKDSNFRGRGGVELLATLMKSVTVPASLSGVDAIARRRPELFEGHFAAALQRRGAA